ncbi:MAG TPA: mercury methylation corrinoid protein HgcA [Methanocella sp.]|nr:mercury methylation corrinoid protein HgcA [Methanocella sp.]
MAITQTVSEIDYRDRLDHFLARWSWKRNEHVVEPGLYALGGPKKESPVFVTANYTLSFDALRSALKGIDCYILVINTYGINVWCAAGKGTFGTDELSNRIAATDLTNIVSHRKLILPQLGAPGVDAFEVTKRTGFKVEYGPIRAADLPEYLKAGKATAEMRKVTFPVHDRIVLIPVELVAVLLPTIIIAIATFLTVGFVSALAAITAVLAGTVLFPLLMPYLPTKDYSSKGLLLGLLAALPFAGYTYLRHSPANPWTAASMLTFLLIMPPITAYLALNFTGSTPYPSRTGVRKEIFTYIPIISGMAAVGLVILVAMAVLRFLKVI